MVLYLPIFDTQALMKEVIKMSWKDVFIFKTVTAHDDQPGDPHELMDHVHDPSDPTLVLYRLTPKAVENIRSDFPDSSEIPMLSDSDQARLQKFEETIKKEKEIGHMDKIDVWPGMNRPEVAGPPAEQLPGGTPQTKSAPGRRTFSLEELTQIFENLKAKDKPKKDKKDKGPDTTPGYL